MATQNGKGLKKRVYRAPMSAVYKAFVQVSLLSCNYNNDHCPSSHNSRFCMISFSYGVYGTQTTAASSSTTRSRNDLTKEKWLWWKLIFLNNLGAIWRNKLGNLNRYLNPVCVPRAPAWGAHAMLHDSAVMLPQLGFWEDGFSNSCHS